MSEHLSDNAPSPQKIGVRELQGNLTAYLRQPGALRGRIRMSEDFDQTPLDVLESMERDL